MDYKELKSNNNVTYLCRYHVVFCVKYRKKLLTEEMKNLFGGIAEKLIDIENRINVLQARNRKKKVHSNSWKRAQKQIRKLYKHKSQMLNDWQHKLTHAIAKNHSIVAIEDLKLKNMSASASGTVENPGKNVAQKRGLNKSLLRVGLAEFARKLGYKIAQRGGILYCVNPHYTSLHCSECGEKIHTHRDGDTFTCHACGITMHADLNAARNVKLRLQNYLQTGSDGPGVRVELLASEESSKWSPPKPKRKSKKSGTNAEPKETRTYSAS